MIILVLGFLRDGHTVFHSGCTSLHSYPRYGRVPFPPHSAQHVLFADFLKWWPFWLGEVVPHCRPDHSECPTESHRSGWGQPPWLLREKIWFNFHPIPGNLELGFACLAAGAGTSLVVQWLRLCASNAGGLGSILGSGKFPGEGSGTHSSILTWRIPWTEEPGRLQSMGS